MNLISAKEARETANKLRQQREYQESNMNELDCVMMEIDEAMNNEQYMISVENLYKPETINELVRLGYELKHYIKYSLKYIDIKW